MASNVFPMLSSSPPPMDDCPDDDDDEEEDEFGNFTSSNIPFDSSFDSPVAVEKFKPFKSGDNGVNNTNFSDEIHKFNFSNSTTPSPQEFVPDFSDENGHSKNGFKPINSEHYKDSKCLNKTEITSHKPVPPVLSEHLAHSLSDNKSLSSKSCDLQKKNVIIKSSKENDHERDSLKNSSSKSDSYGQEAPFVCDSSKAVEDSNHASYKNNSGTNCESTMSSASYVNPEFSDCSKVSSEEECCLTTDKFNCSFNCEDNENDIEEFADFQHSENLFSSNIYSSSLEFDSEFPTAFVEGCSEAALKSDVENKEINEFSDNEFDDFQACKGSIEFLQNAENSETVLKSSIKSEQTSEIFDSELNDFQGCTENMAFDEDENPEVVRKSTIENGEVNEFSDNEFDDFQGSAENMVLAQTDGSCVKSNSDDFQEFHFTDALKEDADDFADFQDFNADDETTVTDDFADFSSAPFDSNKTSQPSDENDFADFKEANFSAPVEASPQATASTQKSIDTLSTVLNAIFPLPDTSHDCDTSDEISPQILEQSNKSRRLWEKLHEVEQAPGLRFQWGVSHSFQQLLRAVNIDYHSILRTSSVPIFASGLSLLEPVKGLSSSANHESEDRNQILKDPIPPVEFDWNSSGLVNPLDFGQSASTLMDLSFLSSVGNGSSETKTENSFESELLKPSPAFVCPDNSSQTQILEQLLSKNVSSLPNSKLSRRPSDLSNEAVRVLDQLPDLSFMQAKVLMFPISSKT